MIDISPTKCSVSALNSPSEVTTVIQKQFLQGGSYKLHFVLDTLKLFSLFLFVVVVVGHFTVME